jgi:sigma54-dependent transcription regulator
LIEMLPYIAPKLSATANVHYDGSFADQLERAIERSKQPALLNGPKTIEHEQLVSANTLKKPFQSYRRF